MGHHADQRHDCSVHPHWNGRGVHPGEAGHWSGMYVVSELVVCLHGMCDICSACAVHLLQDQLHVSSS